MTPLIALPQFALPLVATMLALWEAWGQFRPPRTNLVLLGTLSVRADSKLVVQPLPLDNRFVVAAQGGAPELRVVTLMPNKEVKELHRLSLLGRIKVTKGRQPLAVGVDDNSIYVVTDSWTVIKTDFALNVTWQVVEHDVAASPQFARACSRFLLVLSSDGSLRGIETEHGTLAWDVALSAPLLASNASSNDNAVDVVYNKRRIRIACASGHMLANNAATTRDCAGLHAHRRAFPDVSVEVGSHSPASGTEKCARVRVHALGGLDKRFGDEPCGTMELSAQGRYAWMSAPKPAPVGFAKGLPSSVLWQDVDVTLAVVTADGKTTNLTPQGQVLWSTETSVDVPTSIDACADAFVVFGTRRAVVVTKEGRPSSQLDFASDVQACRVAWYAERRNAVIELASGDVALVSLQRFASAALPSFVFLPVCVLLLTAWVLGCLMNLDV